MKNLKISYHFEFLPTIVHLSSELQKRIPGASSSGIPLLLIQVDSLASLLHFDIKIFKLHYQINFFGHPNVGALVDVEIELFSAYRDDHMRKIP